jgi:hypothetical protein
MVIKIKKVLQEKVVAVTVLKFFSRIDIALFTLNCWSNLAMSSVKMENIAHGYFSWKVYLCFFHTIIKVIRISGD